MNDRNKTLHSFIIAPETLIWILTEKIGQKNDTDEEKDGFRYKIQFGTIFRLRQSQNYPQSKDNFNQYAKGKTLTRNKWKQKRLTNNKRNKWCGKKSADNRPLENIFCCWIHDKEEYNTTQSSKKGVFGLV